MAEFELISLTACSVNGTSDWPVTGCYVGAIFFARRDQVAFRQGFRCPSILKQMLCSQLLPKFSSGPEFIKLFSCSAQLSMKYEMLISIKITENSAFARLR